MEKPKGVSDLPGKWRETVSYYAVKGSVTEGAVKNCADQLEDRIKNGPDLLVKREDLDKAKALIQFVINDEESQAGGWGPDRTMVAKLHEALDVLKGLEPTDSTGKAGE